MIGSRSAERPHAPRQMLSRDEKRCLSAENKKEWLAFPGLPGTHLTWRKGRSGSWELVSGDGAVWASRHGRSVTAAGKSYEVRDVWEGGKRPRLSSRWERRELVDSSGVVVLGWTGTHFKGIAKTVLSLGGINYEFPIRGSMYRTKTVMSAVEIGGPGHCLARFRLTCGWYRAANSWRYYPPRSVEVVVSPNSLSASQMALVIAVASSWLRTYFTGGSG
jgi:hypothetical protein